MPDDDDTEKYRILTAWKWEFFTWVIGAIVIAGTIAILVESDKMSVERWPLAVQINTVVANLA
jgi:enamine deaminase RidA (YjgF/YER057c/UK114 family)